MFEEAMTTLLKNLSKDLNNSGIERDDYLRLFEDFRKQFKENRISRAGVKNLTAVHLRNELNLINRLWSPNKTKGNLNRAKIFFGSLQDLIGQGIAKNLATIIKELIEIAETNKD